MDLFESAEHYPSMPGWKARATSEEAAAKAAPTSHILRAQVLAILSDGVARTPDEVAAIMGKSVLSVRPRFSELSVFGNIVDSGQRRENASGRSAICWRVPLSNGL